MFCGLGVVYLPCGPPLLFFIWGVGDIGYTSITIKKKYGLLYRCERLLERGEGHRKDF